MKNKFSVVMGFTTIWLIIVIIIATNNFIPDGKIFMPKEWIFENFNNWGDFFAGFFAPLAFLWLGYGIFIQREEFSQLSKSVSNQETHMKDQVTLIMSQDLANLYNKFAENLSESLTKIENTIFNDDKDYMQPSTIQAILNSDEKIELIEESLLLNKQINSYFFKHNNNNLDNITKMLVTDYNIRYKKSITKVEELYLKLGALFYASNLLNDIKIKSNNKFSNYLNNEFNTRIKRQIDRRTKDKDYDVMQDIFSSLLAFEPKDFINLGEI